MSNEQKRIAARILTAAVLLVVVLLLPLSGPIQLAAILIPYLVIGWDVLWGAVRHIARGQLFDEHFLMAIATVGAIAIGEYPEAVFVMLLYQIGELFQDLAAGKARQSITALMEICPDHVHLERNGTLETTDPEDAAVGEVMVIKPGERVPLDGVVLEGSSALDTAALTGESLPREVEPGSEVISGCVNLSGVLRARVEKPFEQSTAMRILELVEDSGSKKAKAEKFITRFARCYTPLVVLAAAVLAIVPPLLLHWPWQTAIQRALSFLVVSCPCALVISVPLAFFGGIGGASRSGILVKGSGCLEALARAETVVFDKTGTLTQGSFQVSAIHPTSGTPEELLELAALAESCSNHPISRSLRESWNGSADATQVTDAQELPGRGIRAVVNGRTVYAGNARLMEEQGLTCEPCSQPGTILHLAVDGTYAGHIVISDSLKPDSVRAVADLRAQGVKRVAMLTGDTQATAEAIAAPLHLDELHADLLPQEKVERVEALINQVSERGSLIFVGDGINDAPVLARADLGIAMGALGSDAAIEAADVVLMDDKPSKTALAIAIARRTVAIAQENIVFALGVKLLVLFFITIGWAGMGWAVFADVGVTVLAVLNSARALQTPSQKRRAA